MPYSIRMSRPPRNTLLLWLSETNVGPLNPTLNHTNNPQMNHNNTKTPMIIPASLSMATLFPDAAILPSRPADPFNEVLMEENVSD